MSRFSGRLRELSEKLDLPQPDKSHILLEIASDLDDMYRFYREKGLGEEEAVKRAGEKLDLSDEALRELVEIHESGMRKLLGRISEQARSRWERVLLAMAVILIAAYSGRQLLSAQLYARASRFVCPILIFALAALVVRNIRQASIRGKGRTPFPRVSAFFQSFTSIALASLPCIQPSPLARWRVSIRRRTPARTVSGAYHPGTKMSTPLIWASGRSNQ